MIERSASMEKLRAMVTLKRLPLPILLLFLLGMGAILTVVKDEVTSPLLYHTLRGETTYQHQLFIPASLDPDRVRTLSLDMGDGNCKWTPPVYEVPEDIDFHKTLVAGYPSGDKRMAYLQMEALAGLPAKDEWDFAYQGQSNHPFIKANYPHHEGIWGWGSIADQTILLVPNIRRAMVEYHDILWDLGYATTYEDAFLLKDHLFETQPGVNDYMEWRDSRVLDEIQWYGWHIDYWMEGGLLRDVFTHKMTTAEHWDRIMNMPFFSRGDLAYENYVPGGEESVTPTYDTHCPGDITGGCEPIAIVSADALKEPGATGKQETNVIASALMNDSRTGNYVIAPTTWDCIWTELIEHKKGPKTMEDRPGYQAKDSYEYNFSPEMLTAMLTELDRMITKYSEPEWTSKPTAVRLVEILIEHKGQVQTELDEFSTGQRRLKRKEYLGPRTRARRRATRNEEAPKTEVSGYFISLEQKRFDNKRRALHKEKIKTEKEERRGQRDYPGKEEDGAERPDMSDSDFVAALSNSLTQIRALEAAGGMDKETAMELVERVRRVAMEARVVMVENANEVLVINP